MHWLAKLVFFKILGWKLENNFNPEIKKCVVIVAPHTSSYDFLIGILVRKIMRTKINFVGKKELFKPPLGWYFRAVGGSPIDRTGKLKKVDAIAKIFQEKEIFRLAMSPEGTREKTEQWKTGFYYIAIKAEVPIIRVSFDYGVKKVKISEPYWPTGDFQKDYTEIFSYYDGVEGKIRENF
ncbi:1-acyl-sn-glycerol-3-phosphate acyltransferase [Christiangramia forsetii]|uniref:Phospholipid/glycerol acyltransferase n=2 Tax=Christiangramia forsetii TaxID=411153 RepID=A0M1H2_CHRFK|nr:1-acyl-sn-glycerol-3-phosphate acyltransferase [Christiangramia forsetii]GGG42518.1 acyltransferase [Christiangramia forsetii]CAL66467.1 phospholipid/glycerol acyltransferase [Christiangramia forsetii KT0803]